MSTKVYVVSDVHRIANDVALDLSSEEADRAALAMIVNIVATIGLSDCPEPPVDAAMWRSHLAEVQRRAATSKGHYLTGREDSGDLAAMSGIDVEIDVKTIASPRVVVMIRNGMFEAATSDAGVDLYVVDHDVEARESQPLVLIPSDDDRIEYASMTHERVDVRPEWIDRSMAAYHSDEERSYVSHDGDVATVDHVGMIADLTDTNGDDWKDADGPDSGVGVNYCYVNEIAGLSARINDDQRMLDISVFDGEGEEVASRSIDLSDE